LRLQETSQSSSLLASMRPFAAFGWPGPLPARMKRVAAASRPQNRVRTKGNPERLSSPCRAALGEKVGKGVVGSARCQGAFPCSAGDTSREVQESDSLHSGSEYRSSFRRDYARLLHSPSFRRLQGKTQLFPGFESDFFRTRLTHSLEVAQVAKSIALHLNQSRPELRDTPIDLDLVEFAGLAHDLGHPPFGHNGEYALDKRMKGFGGFEGNAQTFRILSRIEKKQIKKGAPPEAEEPGIVKDIDYRAGLNLTARSLAAVLKYDRRIEAVRESDAKLAKGYYFSEEDLVVAIKSQIAPNHNCDRKFKTIECQIMDLADDIAYSTYDLEDTLKAGFLSPLDLLSLDRDLRSRVAEQVKETLEEVRPGLLPFTHDDVRAQVLNLFWETFAVDLASNKDRTKDEDSTKNEELTKIVHAFLESKKLSSVGYIRTKLTSGLVGEFIAGVQFKYAPECPPLSQVFLDDKTLRKVETLKRLTFNAVIDSPRLKVAEFRGVEIVTSIFDALVGKDGAKLLPADVRRMMAGSSDELRRKRIVCDFVAGMTDSYAIEFYGRLKSENARTIFKPF